MSLPTQGETYAKILDHLIKLQEEAAMMAHLVSANDDRRLAMQWLTVSDYFKKMQHALTGLASGRLN